MHSSTELPTISSLASLRHLPALIDHYFEIVDRVLSRHGFDELACDFSQARRQAPATAFASTPLGRRLPVGQRLPYFGDSAYPGWVDGDSEMVEADECLVAV